MDNANASAADARQQPADLDRRAIDTIRFLAVDAVERANSGHPGMPMGAAPMAYVLWDRFLQHNPADPTWPNRDRFVLSAGHGSMLLYSLLHLTGYDLSMEDIKQFRQTGSRTPGHPENFMTPGVETTTGPLGQGFANGVGMAVAEQFLAARFNRPDLPIVDHYTYGIVSDGDLMEGISHEAASLAGHLKLGKLIYLYDDNEISIDGRTDITFTEDVQARFRAYGWHVVTVEDGNDLDALHAALDEARGEAERPSLIAVRTVIGYGSPNKQDTSASHGSPLGDDEVTLTKRALGWPEEATFHVPDDVAEHMRAAVEAGEARQEGWNALMARYREAYPELADQWDRWTSHRFPDDWAELMPTFETGSSMATRAASGKVLNAVAEAIGYLVGGSADLAGSNKTYMDGRGDHQAATPAGANLHFGVREHAMASMCNGMALHEGVRPFCGTFLIFSDYMRPAVRLSALMGVPVTYVFTHDSIGLGEDGPTHQPVEHLLALRSIPNLVVLRPADANETAEAWKAALQRTDGPTALALTRQKLPTLDRSVYGAAEGVQRGGYILRDADGTPDVILIGSGSEVHVVLAAAERLSDEGLAVRVVSMPSWELFDAQDEDYRADVLPAAVTARVAVEAGVTLGWERYVGAHGQVVGLDRFGASGPAEELFERFGFTPERIAEVAREVAARTAGSSN